MGPITKLLIYLTILCLVDVLIPIPIIGLILIYVVLEKPAWFLDLAHRVYADR